MSKFKHQGKREAAWGRWYARRGVTADDVLASERPPYPSEREHMWRLRYERVPIERKVSRA